MNEKKSITVAHIDLPFFGKVGAATEGILTAFKRVLLGTHYVQDGREYAVVGVEWGTNKVIIFIKEIERISPVAERSEATKKG